MGPLISSNSIDASTFETAAGGNGDRRRVAAPVPVNVFGSSAYAPALGWVAASLTFLIWVWIMIGRLNPAGTAAHAGGEDPRPSACHLLVLAATIASFAGVGRILLDAGSAQGTAKAAFIGLALISVALSWLLVHTMFTLRYAYLYYRYREGVDFNEDKPPHYRDFAYLASR